MKADHFSADIQEFLTLLHNYNVRYLIIGGEAIIYYGHIRFTGDIDFFYDCSAQNAEKLYNVLISFWDGAIPGVKNKNELTDPEYVIQFGVPPNRIDLLSEIDNVAFKEAWRDKKTELVQIENEQIPIHFLSLQHLIENKEQAGRPKDLEDLKYLRSVE